jgi:polysaccharide biosynthesis PFTS motif protein
MSKISTQINISRLSSKKKINLVSGPIWSSQKFENMKLNFPPKKKIISFFASSYAHSGMNMFEDHYKIFEFFNKISLIPKVLIVFKGKGDFSNYCKDERIYKIYLKLKKENKILIMKKHYAARYIINASDIIISMPFSTPSFEALYLKKPCFFLDINNNYKNSFIDLKTKNFVAHNFSDGEKILKNLLKNKNFCKKSINYNFDQIFGNENLRAQDPIDFIKKKIF